MKKFKYISLVLLLTLLLSGCGKNDKNTAKDSEQTSAGNVEKIHVKLAGTNGEKDTQSMGMLEVKERLEETGLFEVEVFLSGALGGTDDVLEQGLQGVPVVSMSDPGRLATYVKDFGIIQMPYILEDPDDLDILVESDLYKKWEKEFENQGIKLIASNWYNGPRNFVLNDEVNTPEDLHGKKIRTIGNEIFVSSINAMGAVATPMEWSEVYPSIQQGAIDGCEAQSPSVYPTRLYEICKFVNKTEHFQLVTCPVMGADVFNSWPEEAQETFMKVFKEVGVENRKIVKEAITEYEDAMAKEGMTIHELDKQPFIDAVQPIYEKLGYSELRDEFKDLIGE